MSYSLSLSRVGLIYSTSPTNFSSKSSLLFSHLRLPLPRGNHPSNVATILPYRCHIPTISFFLMWFFQKFKVCKSVHHCTIQINHKPNATIFQLIILTFIYSSTNFGRFPAHHQEFNDCSVSLCFYLRIVVTVVLCSWSDRPDHEHSTIITTIRR
jgi:hypothetical protein